MDKHKGENNLLQTITKLTLFLVLLAIQILVFILLYKGTNSLLIYA